MNPISITPCPSLDRDEPIGKTSHDSVQQQSKLCLHQFFSNPYPSPCTSFPSRHACLSPDRDNAIWENIPRLSPATEQTTFTPIFIQPHPSPWILFPSRHPSALNQTGTKPIGNKSHDSVWSQSYLHLHLRPFSFISQPFIVVSFSFTPHPQTDRYRPTGN